MAGNDQDGRVLTVVDSRVAVCGNIVGGLTDEEVGILTRMRALHEAAVALRAAAAAGVRDATDAEARIADFRRQRAALVELRDAARHRRMVLLGHEEEGHRR